MQPYFNTTKKIWKKNYFFGKQPNFFQMQDNHIVVENERKPNFLLLEDTLIFFNLEKTSIFLKTKDDPKCFENGS